MIKFNESTTTKDSLDISKDYFFFIKDIFNEYSKYLKQYKTLMVSFTKKLNQLQEKFGQSLLDLDKIKNKYRIFKIKDIFELISVVPNIVQKLANNFNSSVKGLEPIIQEIDKILSEKINIDKKDEDELEFDSIKNNLMKCYKTIDKNKLSFMNKMSSAEDTILKYYSNIENQNFLKEKNKKDKDKLDNITTKEQLEQYISQIKKAETQYLSSFDSIIDIEKSFNNISQKYKKDLSNFSLDLTQELKKIILDTTLMLKNSFSEPLSEIAIIFESLNDFEKNVNLKKIIDDSFNIDKNIVKKQPKQYKIKIINEPKMLNGKRNPNCLIFDLEDGFETVEYYKDYATLNTINQLYENFELVEKDNKFNYKKEFNKIKTKEITKKLLSYADDGKKKKFSDTGNIKITQEEINILKDILNDHSNRVIFLLELSTFRATGLYCVPKDIFDLFNDLFIIMTNTIGRDKDFPCAKNLIILSQTYYHLNEGNKGNKHYLQDDLKNNKIFKNIKFWEEYMDFSIEKEIINSIEQDKRNGTLIKKTQKESDDKYANIIFAQLVSIADNMISFGCDTKNVKEIIKPKIKHYNINEESIKVIDDIIHKDKKNLRKSISLSEEIKSIDINKLIEYYKNFDVFGNKSNIDLNNNQNDEKLEDIYEDKEIVIEKKEESNEGEKDDKK